MLMDICCCVFFFKQKTAYEMRISDGSSDVCSSDLRGAARPRRGCDGDVEELSGEELSGEELSGEELSGEELSGEGLKGRTREGHRPLAERGGLPVNAAAMSIMGQTVTWLSVYRGVGKECVSEGRSRWYQYVNKIRKKKK